MHAAHPILSALLLLASIPVAHALPGAASDWQPPTLVPHTPAPETPPPSTPPAPTVIAAATAPGAEAPAAEQKPQLRPAHKRCKNGKARCPRRAPKIDPRLTEASKQRARLLEMATTGRPGDAARLLGGAAAAHTDPILYLAAAQAELTGAQVSGEHLTRALRLTQEAQRLITTPTDLRISAAEGPALSAEVEALTNYVTRRQTQLRRQRRGKAELATGATFLVLGATGLGMLASGAALTSRLKARGPYTGEDAEYLAGLKNTEQRAGKLLTAGILLGLFGAALGIPLTIVGARDLKRARSGGAERPSFRLVPGLSGVSISGKF